MVAKSICPKCGNEITYTKGEWSVARNKSNKVGIICNMITCIYHTSIRTCKAYSILIDNNKECLSFEEIKKEQNEH